MKDDTAANEFDGFTDELCDEALDREIEGRVCSLCPPCFGRKIDSRRAIGAAAAATASPNR